MYYCRTCRRPHASLEQASICGESVKPEFNFEEDAVLEVKLPHSGARIMIEVVNRFVALVQGIHIPCYEIYLAPFGRTLIMTEMALVAIWFTRNSL